MKSWKKQGRKRRRLTGHGAFRTPMELIERRKRAVRAQRTNRAGKIKRKTKVIPRGAQE